jgi:hypothetical protein
MDQERTLTESQRDEFEDMLRALTLERSQIREAMGFALNNSEAAGEVYCNSFLPEILVHHGKVIMWSWHLFVGDSEYLELDFKLMILFCLAVFN